VFRWFRLFEKKRGDRRTGSSLQGRLGEAAFFGAMFLLGATYLSNVIFQEITHPTGAPHTIGLGFWLQVLVLVSFVLIGGSGVVWAVFHSRTSVERRSAIVNDANNLDLIQETIPTPRDYPTLPLDVNLINSPGVVLPYRLPSVESPIWGLLAATIFCLAWNGMTSVLAVYATRSWGTAKPEWFLSFLLVPFIGVGCWAIFFLLQQVVVHAAMGPLTVEISHHPLYPGRTYKLLLSMTGNLRIQSLEVHLTCEEQVTFHQGTDVRHESHDVFRQQFFRISDFRIEPSVPLEQLLEFTIPPGAMHSFQSAHNSVQWKLVVTGVAEVWPAFQRSFPMIIQPLPPPTNANVEIRLQQRETPLAPIAEKVGA
jgi:hypothetical protein